MQSTAVAARENQALELFAKAKLSRLPKNYIYVGADLQCALEHHDRLVVTATVPGKEERFAISGALTTDQEKVDALVGAAISWIASMLAQTR